MPSFRDRRVLITGASGFIGSHLSGTLRESGAVVHTLSRNAVANLPASVQQLGDLRDAKFVASAVAASAPEFIFHLAAYKNRGSDLSQFAPAIETNLLGSLNLISAASGLNHLASIVVLGTAEEYGGGNAPFGEEMREHPVSAYSLSKLCLTQLCQTLSRLHGLPLVALRPTIAYGPGQAEDMFLPALIKTLIRNEAFDMTAGMQTRDFVYVADLVGAMTKAALRPEARGEVLNIGSGNPVAIGEIALVVERMLGKSGLVRLGARDYRVGEVMNYFVANQRARDLLDWAPSVTLEKGLADTVAHYRAQG